MFDWQDFVRTLKETRIEFDRLKLVQLAQAMHESGRGTSELFRRHGNPYGMKFRREMHAIATSVRYEASDGPDQYCEFDDADDAVEGYWVFLGRAVYSGWRNNAHSPEDFLRFIVYAGYFGGPFDGTAADRERKETYIGKVTRVFDEARGLLGEPASLVDAVPAPDAPPIWRAGGVLLEVGHGRRPDGTFDPGAVGHGDVREYDLNRIAAEAARATIAEAGVPCVVTDAVGELPDIGRLARGHDVFCSIHHNSAGSRAQGAEALIHARKGDPADAELANLISAEVAKELGIPDRNRRNGTPKRSLGVLSGAEETDVRASVLAEVYFIHVPVPDTADWSTRGGRAVGRGILAWLRATAAPPAAGGGTPFV